MQWLMLALLVACGGRARQPTITGAQLYAQVHVLRDTGAATIGAVTVRKDQALATSSQQFLVAQLIDRCKGGDPAQDVDCALALLLGETFSVHDGLRAAKAKKDPGEDRSSSALTTIVVLGVATAAAAGLVYGVATCEFEGCKAVFGVPLVLVGGGVLFVLLGH